VAVIVPATVNAELLKTFADGAAPACDPAFFAPVST
jgi:hypothetical protein